MRDLDLLKTDLNLLIVLRALLDTRSVGQAADRLGMSQPAVSRALARLRRQFGDRLLIKGGHSMTPTLRAEALAGPLAALLGSIEAFVAGTASFDAASTTQVFRLATTDYGAIAVLPAVLPHLRRLAPAAGLEILPFGRDVFRALGEGTVDLALYSDDPVPNNLRTSDLFVEDYACLVRAGHPAAARARDAQIGMDDYLAHDHALVTVLGGRTGVVDAALGQLGLSRRVSLFLPYFATAALLVGQSDLILTLPRRAAEASAAPLGLTLLRAPLALESFGYCMVWHERTHADHACAWLRALVHAAVDRTG